MSRGPTSKDYHFIMQMPILRPCPRSINNRSNLPNNGTLHPSFQQINQAKFYDHKFTCQ